MNTFLLIVIVLLVVGLVAFGRWYNSPSHKGKMGEARIHEQLVQLPDEYHVLEDVVLKTDRGTTQIDHIVVSKYGVFAIETKNYSGEIYGDDNRKEWTQIIVTEVRYRRKWYKTYTYVTKNQFYNPVKQSLIHTYEIKNHFTEWPHLRVTPIVVFAGSAILNNVKSKNHVIYDYDLLSTIKGYKTIYLSDTDVQKIVNRLAELNVRETVDNKTHVRNIKEAKKELNSKLSAGICPKCGGTLVERTGKYGRFYGCSNYPDCKFTTH